MTSPQSAAGTATVLLVDDEESVRRVLARELTEAGLAVVQAGNGEQALQAARDHDGQFHVVITDISMPLMDGLEFARSFRPLYPRVPILFMTGNAAVASLAIGSEPQENLLRKPFGPDVFLKAVLRAIDGARRSGRTSA